MLRVVGVEVDAGDRVVLSFRDTGAWTASPAPPRQLRLAAVLLGDEERGPVVNFTALPPTDGPVNEEPAHGHDCASWRIPLRGRFSMGRDTYEAGRSRFQEGSKPYGIDNYAWGPEGGWGVIVMGDRRGIPVRPVKKELAPDFDAMFARIAAFMGIRLPEVYDGDTDVVTNVGDLRGGRAEVSFGTADGWPEVLPAVRVAAGLVGEREVGPVVFLVRGEPGRSVFTGDALDTEAVFLVQAGSCTVGNTSLQAGDCLLHRAGTACDGVVSGPEGVSLVVLLGDRRGGPPSHAGEPVARAFRAVVDELRSRLSGLPRAPVTNMCQ